MKNKQTKLLFCSLLAVLLVMVFSYTALAKVELTYWHPWGGRWGEKQIEIVDQFNNSHPDIEVEVVQIPGEQITQKLMTATVSGNPPDLVIVWGGMDPITFSDYFMRLDSYLEEAGMDRDEWVPNALEFNSYDGKLYGLPWVGGTFGLYYNKDMFKEAGLDPDAPPETWAELETYSEKLTKRNQKDDIERLGYILPRSALSIVINGWSNGGQWWDEEEQKVTLTDPKNIEAAKWMISFIRDIYGLQDMDDFLAGNDPNPFANKRTAMNFSGPWDISWHREIDPDIKFGITNIPHPEGGQTTNIYMNDAMYIPAGTDNPEEAWTFMKWMATEGNSIWARWGMEFPARYETFDAPEFEDELFQKFVDFVETSKIVEVPVRSFFNSKLEEAFEYALYGKKTVEKAFADAQKEIMDELKRNQR